MGRVTLAGAFSHEAEVRHSRFIARAAPAAGPEEALAVLARVRDPDATHNCWAYRAGRHYRFSDDGEPGGTAGRPILSAIEGQGLDGVVVVVTRHYGGVNLGAGGLARAYGGAAAECLRLAPRREIVARVRLELRAPFEFSDALFRLLAAAERESEAYDDRGLRLRVSLEESQLGPFQARLRDATRGQARLQVLERFES